MMYLEFFGLQAKPFHSTPDPYFLYLSPSHKQALGSIIYGVKEKKGFIAVTGEVGLGKTTILRVFLEQFDQATQQTINLFNPNMTFAGVLRVVLSELGHEPIKGSDAEVVEQLHKVLIEEHQKGRSIVLLIDEAQNMPVATLEQLRMLSNLETTKDKLIQIVLLGQPELDSILDRYELRQIRQRIALRAVIHPLSEDDSFQYIRHRLDKAGGEGKTIFTNGALKRIVREAKGIPRRLNILCDNALVTALGYQKNPVTARIANEVINDLAGKSSHALWKLIPLAAGVLILLLALVALMPLTNFKFSHTAQLEKIGNLFDQGVNPSQSTLNVAKGSNPSNQEDEIFNETIFSVTEESEPIVAEPVDTSSIQRNSEVPRQSIVQPLQRVTAKLEERSTPESMPEFLGVSDTNPALQSDNLKQAPVPLAPPVNDNLEEQSTPEGMAQVSVVNDTTSAAQSNSLKEPPVPPAQPVSEKLEERSTPEGMAQVRPVNDTTSAPQSENLKQPLAQPVRDKPKELPRQDAESRVRPVTNPEIESALSNEKPNNVSLVLPLTRIMKKGETLAGLMQEVYGSASPAILRLVLKHNSHIVNVRRIYPGQQIVFPSLTKAADKGNHGGDASVLVSHTGKELRSSKKIFTQSSARTKSTEKKVKETRMQPYAVVVVQEGDTLQKLATIVYGTSDPLIIQQILDLNPKILNSKKIVPGQNIVFPRIAEKKE